MTKERFNERDNRETILKPTKLLEFGNVIVDNYTLKELMISDNVKVSRVEVRPLEDFETSDGYKFYGYKTIVDFIVEDNSVSYFAHDVCGEDTNTYLIDIENKQLKLNPNKIDFEWWDSYIVKQPKTKKVKK